MKKTRIALVSLCLCPFAPAFAGSIITTNVPNGGAIINIDGQSDGAAGYGGDNQTYWYSPFSQDGNLLEYTFQPGTYSFQIVDPTDAATLCPALTSAQLSSVYTAWTYNDPFVTDYLAFDSSAVTNSNEYQLFTGAVTQQVPGADGWIGGGYDSPGDAYSAAQLGGYSNQIVAGEGGRYGGTTQNSYTFTQAETVVFAVPDYDVTDNGGGVSVLVTPAPEPVSASLLLMGGLALLKGARRKRN